MDFQGPQYVPQMFAEVPEVAPRSPRGRPEVAPKSPRGRPEVPQTRSGASHVLPEGQLTCE